MIITILRSPDWGEITLAGGDVINVSQELALPLLLAGQAVATPTATPTKTVFGGGGGSTPDATTLVKGKVQLAGALGGTSAAPTALGLADNAALVAQVASQIATAINSLVNGAGASLDTLNELANALGNDANFATTVTTLLAGKAPLAPVVEDVATGSAYTIIATDKGKRKHLVDASAQQVNVNSTSESCDLFWETSAGTVTIHPSGVQINGSSADIVLSQVAGAVSLVKLASGNFSLSGSIGDLTAADITDSTSAGRTLLTAADAAAQRTAMGVPADLVGGTTISASRALASTDVGKLTVVDTSGGAVALNMPSGAITARQRMYFIRKGANALTFTNGTGGTIVNPDSVTVADGAVVCILGDPSTANQGIVV